MSDKPSIIIAGAGIGGLTVATALSKAGCDVTVLEKASKLEEVGAGIQLSANAMHVMDVLGLKAEIMKMGFEPDKAILRDGYSGRAQLVTALRAGHETRYGQPYIHIHRADLQSILVKAAKASGVKMKLGHSVQGYEQNSEITVETDKTKFAGDYLIGADGIHSAVRNAMLGETQAEFTGQTAWRALIPTTAELRKIVPPDATVWMGKGAHLVSYYVRGGTMINIVAVQESDVWAEEGWTQKGEILDLQNAFNDYEPRVQTLLQEVEGCSYWGLFERPAPESWVDGRVALLGDAAHAMLPFLAQGGAMAIEDAWVLAHHFLEGKALSDFENTRRKRTEWMQNKSRRQGGLYHLGSPLSRSARWTAFTLAHAFPFLERGQLDPIYRMNVTADFPIKL